MLPGVYRVPLPGWSGSEPKRRRVVSTSSRGKSVVPVTKGSRMEIRKNAPEPVLLLLLVMTAVLLGGTGRIHVRGEAFKSGRSWVGLDLGIEGGGV